MRTGARIRGLRFWMACGPFLATCALAAGCGSTLHFQQLAPDQQALSRGTEPGWHSLSPWFGVEVKKGSALDAATARFYLIPDSTAPGSRKELGRQYVYWPAGELADMKHEFGPRSSAFAVSPDGRALLYFVEPAQYLSMPHEEWSPKPYGASLHLYRVGVGDSVIVTDVDHWVDFGKEVVPADGVRCRLPDKQGHGTRTLWTLGPSVVRSCSEFLPAGPDTSR